VDTVLDGATVGGTVATGLCGPLRMRYGAVRDLLIGVTVVRADGTVAKSGGTVVKNVAGYDLGKLYTGSYGTLGVVTEAVFRLHPLPAQRTWVCTTVADAGTAIALADRIRDSQLDVSALELDRLAPGGPAILAVLVEGVPAGVSARAVAAADLLGDGAHVDRRPPPWWARLPWQDGWVGLKLSCPLSSLRPLLGLLDQAAARSDVTAHLRGSAGAGVCYVGLHPDDPGSLAGFVSSLRRDLDALGAYAVVVCAPEDVRTRVDVWGPVPGLDLMRRVKTQFDPDGRLSPGRFVGGI
jgi:glycolate oxidase FAD binding subunit